MAPGPHRDFFNTLTAAINDLVEHGFDSMERVNYWTEELRKAAERAAADPARLEQQLSDALTAIYQRLVDRGELARYHPGIARFTVERIRPQLRAELDRRIRASANLIKLNREAAIEKTLQRFQGWSTSLPKGPSRSTDKTKTKDDIRKSLAGFKYEDRRLLIDQGHKLTAAINHTVAAGGGALAMIWHSHWRQPGYNYREDHKERDEQVYLLRNSWAHERGLVKPGPAGYYDDITAVAEEPFCRCNAQWLYHLRDLPADMVTKKGQEEQERVRRALAS